MVFVYCLMSVCGFGGEYQRLALLPMIARQTTQTAAYNTPATGQTIHVDDQLSVAKLHARYMAVAASQ